MSIAKAYAVICVKDIDAAREWYAGIFGRDPDGEPMDGLCEWYFAGGGLQVFEDAKRAGKSRLTLVTTDIGDSRDKLAKHGLKLGEQASGESVTVAQIKDPDGNIVTFAEPGAGTMIHLHAHAGNTAKHGTKHDSNVTIM